jgi:hypothetical protein
MNEKEIKEALHFCRPNAEWQFLNGEFIWLDKTQIQPTSDELKIAYEESVIAKESEKIALAEKRATLLAKLGITEDEARLLLGGN